LHRGSVLVATQPATAGCAARAATIREFCQNDDVRSETTSLERKLLGIVAFTLGAVPTGVIAAMLIASAVDATVPSWAYTAGFVAFIITAGLQFPVFIILGAVASDDVPETDKSMPRPRLRHPFSLFEFWWRHIR
jgi:protein-S-isoprenylcysteine O-methyltransferase Ste14